MAPKDASWRPSVVPPTAATCTGKEKNTLSSHTTHAADDSVLRENHLGTYHSPARLRSDKKQAAPVETGRTGGATAGSVYTFSFFFFAKLKQSLFFS